MGRSHDNLPSSQNNDPDNLPDNPDAAEERYLGVYNRAYAQLYSGNKRTTKKTIFLSPEDAAAGGSAAVNAAYEDAKSAGHILYSQEKPTVEILKPEEAASNKPERRKRSRNSLSNRAKAQIAVGVLALGGVLSGLAGTGYAIYSDTAAGLTSGTNWPVPSTKTIAEFKSDTNAACSARKDDLPPGVEQFGHSYFVSGNVNRVVIARDDPTIVVDKDANVGELYYCSPKGRLQVEGRVGRLGIMGDYSEIHIDGDAGLVYMNNNFEYDSGFFSPQWTDSQITVSGIANTIVNHGYSGDEDEDVLVSGRVEHYIQTESSREPNFFYDIDTRDDGKIGHIQQLPGY